jgi:hypothetical protein
MKSRYVWSFVLLLLAIGLFAFLDLKAQSPDPMPSPLQPELVVPLFLIQLRVGTAGYREFLANWDRQAELAAYYRGRREALEELLATFPPLPVLAMEEPAVPTTQVAPRRAAP